MIADSLQYYAAATTLARSGSLVVPIAFSAHEQFDATGALVTAHPFVLWPPGYPLLLAGLMRFFSVTPAAAAAVLNVLALAVMLLCVVALTRRATERGAVAVAATALLGVLPPVQRVFRMGLSDGVFLACCALALLAMVRWVDTAQQRRVASSGSSSGLKTRRYVPHTWLVSLAVAAAIHMRYVGVLLVPVHALCVGKGGLVRSVGRVGSVGKVRWVGSVVAGPVLGSAFLVHRWLTLGCTLCAERLGSGQPLSTNIVDLFHSLIDSLPAVYELVPGPVDTVVSFALVAATLVLAARVAPAASSGLKTRRYVPDLPSLSGLSGPLPQVLALAFAAVYLLGILALRTTIEFNSLDARLVAPAAVAILAVGVGVAFSRVSDRAAMAVAALGVLAFFAAGVTASGRVAWRGLSDEQTRALPLVAAAHEQLTREPDVPLFTPDATIVQHVEGIDRPVYFLPLNGLPQLGSSQRAVAMVRPFDTRQTREITNALDAAGRRVVDRPGIIAWELRGSQAR